MPINFKTIPWRKPTGPKSTQEVIEQRKTQEVVKQEFEQLNFQLEVEQDFDDLAKTEQLQLNLEIEEFDPNDKLERYKNAIDKLNQYSKASFAIASSLAIQAIRSNIASISTLSGNDILQQRLQRTLNFGGQAIGVAIGFAVNPILGVSAVVSFATNLALKEQQTTLQRQRQTRDNQDRLEILGGISKRGNR